MESQAPPPTMLYRSNTKRCLFSPTADWTKNSKSLLWGQLPPTPGLWPPCAPTQVWSDDDYDYVLGGAGGQPSAVLFGPPALDRMPAFKPGFSPCMGHLKLDLLKNKSPHPGENFSSFCFWPVYLLSPGSRGNDSQ